ncbi:hypothetical protein ACL2XG_05425 [Sodalis sp. RH24]
MKWRIFLFLLMVCLAGVIARLAGAAIDALLVVSVCTWLTWFHIKSKK